MTDIEFLKAIIKLQEKNINPKILRLHEAEKRGLFGLYADIHILDDHNRSVKDD